MQNTNQTADESRIDRGPSAKKPFPLDSNHPATFRLKCQSGINTTCDLKIVHECNFWLLVSHKETNTATFSFSFVPSVAKISVVWCCTTCMDNVWEPISVTMRPIHCLREFSRSLESINISTRTYERTSLPRSFVMSAGPVGQMEYIGLETIESTTQVTNQSAITPVCAVVWGRVCGKRWSTADISAG